MVDRVQALIRIIALVLAVSPLFAGSQAQAKENDRTPASVYFSPESVFSDPNLKNAMINPAPLPPPSAFSAQEKHLVESTIVVPVANGRVPSYRSAGAF